MYSRKLRYIAATTAMVLVSATVQAGQTCKDSAGNSPCTGTNSPCVCVSWTGADPEEGTDVTFDFSDSANPDVTLKTGSTTWSAWSQEHATDATPDNLGDLKIDPTVSSDDFSVSISAANLGSAVLDDVGFTGYSSVRSCSITGNLNGNLTVVKDSAGDGGVIVGTISGDVSAGAKITAEKIAVATGLYILGDLNGDLDILTSMAGNLWVYGAVGSGADMSIELASGGLTWLNYDDASDDDVAGTIVLTNGVTSASGLTIDGALLSGASIDLENNDVAHVLTVSGGGAGDILNGGAVSYIVRLANGATKSYSGTATFASTTAAGVIKTLNSADLAGTVSITGASAGDVLVDGDLTSAGNISIGGSLTGDVKVGGDVGNNTAEDSIYAYTIGGGGRILIDGTCDGDIVVATRTNSTSLIRATGGIDDNCSIVINDDRGNHSAGGDILIGPASWIGQVPDVVFDGNIVIQDTIFNTYGDLDGDIDVNGCHATADDMDICVCGSTNGSLNFSQSGCSNQVKASCVSGCP